MKQLLMICTIILLTSGCVATLAGGAAVLSAAATFVSSIDDAIDKQ